MIKKLLGHGAQSPKIFLVDDIGPEDLAMLQALYSRSVKSVERHLDAIYARRRGAIVNLVAEHMYCPPSQGMSATTAEAVNWAHRALTNEFLAFTHGEGTSARAGEFFRKFYIGYNHKSIGDCGTTTLFFENVSLLAAKTIQDNPLYNGQETSTRYIDMSKQRILDPVGTVASAAIQQRWLDFYLGSQEAVATEVRRRYPRQEGEDEEAYEGAVKARGFDVLRGFLPAGITTQLSWHSNLRQLGDNLPRLVHHPLEELRSLGLATHEVLMQQYPSSTHVLGGAENAEREAWQKLLAETHTYPSTGVGSEFESTILRSDLKKYKRLLDLRPRGERLPHWMSDLGQMTWRFDLDFGSFRDLQRHRYGVCRMPLLDPSIGFEGWYLDQLPEDLLGRAESLIEAQELALLGLDCDEFTRQNYIALGYLVPCEVTYSLPAALYMLEMRSGAMVHPTMRAAVHRMISNFENHDSANADIKLYADMNPDAWSVRRGTQTITEKST